ncbi:hypothetical protein [Halorarum halobium]|uniref:hypothetical protein n=1 Tax=Halorarum halobium TaxID=3075121 RepID=UPI0028A6CE75|nr:hypothetical protein [Halobaculum sp. XH14]
MNYSGGSLGRRAHVETYLGGPATTPFLLAVTVFVVPALDGAARVAALVLAYSFGIQLLVTLAPVEYPDWWGTYAGTKSDGRRVLDALRGA